jgi:hypothetical protein
VIDPRLRQRAVATPRASTASLAGLSNEELLRDFERSLDGKLADNTLLGYTHSIRDAIRYFRTSEGEEVPVALWTRDAVWKYVQFVEDNYCANYHVIAYNPPPVATCRARVWLGAKNAETAARENCAGCPLFRRPIVKHRLNALCKFFKHLARRGVIQNNFMRDLREEHTEENPTQRTGEKRRNPTVDEEVKLVNGTTHPQRRAFYATSAKWWYRPNEMRMLDRYASFGLPSPTGEVPTGFEHGFTAHPELASFEDGGDLVYLPDTKGARDKRKGNRWSVIDRELRPILEQFFAWWEASVARDERGMPLTTSMWLGGTGRRLLDQRFYPTFFTKDCLRLGLLTEQEVYNPKRNWTSHCQRHFGEQLLEMNNVPDSWCNHFRGDAFKDARGHYFAPTPQQVREKYRELVPLLGFKPLPDAPRLRGGMPGRGGFAVA